MKEWIKENGGALIVVDAIVGIGVGGLNYLDRINDGVNENREELRAVREEQREAREELRSEQRETREELRSEIRENRGAIGVLRVEMNDGFVHVYDRVEESDKETTRRMDAANGRIDAANGMNVDTNRRIDELSGRINSRNDPANVVQSSGEDASGS